MKLKSLSLGGLSLAGLALFSTGLAAQSLPSLRMTPEEIRKLPLDNNQIGSSLLPGVHTKVLAGDPSKTGFYTILLFVPAHTTIQAHSHRDDRMATVVSGDWHFGYGDRFDTKALKTLPVGSVYSEPAVANHFAQTQGSDVVIEISGYGPTDTRYVEPERGPESKKEKPGIKELDRTAYR